VRWFSRFVANAIGSRIPPRIIGCLDLHYGTGPKSEESFVLIPAELETNIYSRRISRKILILHTFFVVDLLDDYKFYVDVREEGKSLLF
jgi:hypothetical protein